MKYYQIYNSKTNSLVKSFSKKDIKMTRNKHDALSYATQELALSKLEQIKELYKQNSLEWMAEDIKLKKREN